MTRYLSAALVIAALAATPAARQTAGTDADRAAIRAHIDSIFQAFIDGDTQAIYDTHAQDWRGFLEGSRTPIRGVDEYMRANGIPWPPAPGTKPAPRATPPASAGTRTYRVREWDLRFETPDVAIASFVGDFLRTLDGDTTVTSSYRIMDIYGKRNGKWIQVASHTVVDPAWMAERMAQPVNVPAPVREQILKAREAVWRAIFANDRAAMAQLMPKELIAIENGADWKGRDEIFADAAGIAARGATLARLEFPRTDLQVYGNGAFAILYTTYAYDLVSGGQKTTSTGTATEMFVRRPSGWVNVGWHLSK